MLTSTANRDSHPPLPSFWPRVRRFAVPASMIETATARREAGDWAGACAAARVDVDLQLRSVASSHGRELAACIRADLRHLAPDLLRWHLPRIAPHGLLRPGLTIELAHYDPLERDGPAPLHLVVRTPPAWADAGQRISLALWDGSHAEPTARRHPHPHPNRRFRLDLHRHLWDARRADELRLRSGADGLSTEPADAAVDPDLWSAVPADRRCAVDRWAAEAATLLRAERQEGQEQGGAVSVRLGGRRRLLLRVENGEDGWGTPVARIAAVVPDQGSSAAPVLPDAATWVLPDLDLLRTGAVAAGQLHPLVARALVPGPPPPTSAPARSRTGDGTGATRLVDCRGAQHRIGLVDGALAPLDHDPAEIRREELLVALTGTPLPCLRAIDEAHRRPDCLTGVRERLDHGDIAGALDVVEGLLGPEAVLREGPLRDELEAAARRRITYGLFRAGLLGSGPLHRHSVPRRLVAPRPRRARRPRHTTVS
ncbi:hypothetical protein [Streptomyces sp. S063]|uniref:hypothetical protein n=1 Tax=Streptomyces sp. S063 TaxID=2005885 RepID=UPI0010085228|nr:hypothetical protein [Streptomyces sp. S063]